MREIGEGVLDSLIADEDDVSGETLARILGALRVTYAMGHKDATSEWATYDAAHNTCVDEAFDCGAAVAFGLMGMAEAIRISDLQRKSPTGCRVCPPDSYCHHCGAVWWSCLCPDQDDE